MNPTYLGHILDLYCVRLSNAALFCENYAKLYFDARLLENRLNRGGWGTLFLKSVLFHKKVLFLTIIECCSKFLEYFVLVLSIILFDFF